VLPALLLLLLRPLIGMVLCTATPYAPLDAGVGAGVGMGVGAGVRGGNGVVRLLGGVECVVAFRGVDRLLAEDARCMLTGVLMPVPLSRPLMLSIGALTCLPSLSISGGGGVGASSGVKDLDDAGEAGGPGAGEEEMDHWPDGGRGGGGKSGMKSSSDKE